MNRYRWGHVCVAVLMTWAAGQSQAQMMNFGAVKATGAKPLSADEVKALVTDAQTRFLHASGGERRWRNAPDGKFAATRTNGPVNRRNGAGTWSVRDDGAYCLSFDWGPMDNEKWCRLVYKVEDRYYAFGDAAPDEAPGGPYWFTR